MLKYKRRWFFSVSQKADRNLICSILLKECRTVHCDFKKSFVASPAWHGSVGWALSHKEKGCQFESQSEHMPGLHVWSLVGMCMTSNWLMCLSHIDLSLHFFLSSPISLSKKKEFYKSMQNLNKNIKVLNSHDLWEFICVCSWKYGNIFLLIKMNFY